MDRRLTRLVVASLAVLAAGALSCGPGTEPDPDPTPGEVGPTGFEWGDEIVCADPFEGWNRFASVGVERGLTEPMADPSEVLDMRVFGMGGGLTIQDLDGDGDLDVLASQFDGPPDVYANDGAGFFELQPSDAVPTGPLTQHNITAAVDLDDDGLPELLLGAGRQVFFSRNLGGLRWTPIEDVFPQQELGTGTTQAITLADVDADGDLDLAATRHATVPGGDVDAGGLPDLLLTNDGDGGSWTVAQHLVSTAPGSITQIAMFTDRDLDGDPDLFIPNDNGPPSGFYRHDGQGPDGPIFVNDAEQIGAALDMAAMGIDNADLNGDGDLDYCMSDVGPPRCLLSDGFGGYYESGAAIGLEPDVSAGFPSTVGWGFDFGDLNADGNLDAVHASGPEQGAYEAGLLEIMDLVWAGVAGGTFVDVTAETGLGDTAANYGAVTGDLTGDGFLDVLVAGPGVPPNLYVNRCGAGAWVELDLLGPPGNTDGIGARAVVRAGEWTQSRELMTLRGRIMGPSRLHFGLGDIETIDSIRVYWPDGAISEATDLPVRRRMTVDWAVASGEAVGDDDDDATAPPDDDDSTEPPDDDDTTLDPGPGEIVIDGFVFEPGTSPGEGTGLAGRHVYSSHDAETVAETEDDGAWALVVPEEAEVEVHLGDADLFPHLLALQTSWQNGPNAGVFQPLFTVDSYDGFHTFALGVPRQPGTGSLWVQVSQPMGQLLMNSSADLDRSYEAVASFGKSDPVPGNVLGKGSTFLVFGNVDPGPVEVEVTTPDGETCIGRTSVEVPPDVLTQVSYRCE